MSLQYLPYCFYLPNFFAHFFFYQCLKVNSLATFMLISLLDYFIHNHLYSNAKKVCLYILWNCGINHKPPKKLNPGHVHSYFLFTFSESIDNSIILKIEVIEDIYISCSSLRLWMNSMEISFKTYLQFNPLSRVCFYHDTVSLYAFW